MASRHTCFPEIMRKHLSNKGRTRLSWLPFFLLLHPLNAAALSAGKALTDYSLEQLMEVSIEVTSAARKPQKLEDTAAAIHVITQEDIRRSGMTSLPELLRMVPGIQVANIDGSTWAISSRGFNAKNSDNLLVMLDGRTLHTQTFTGVYWDAQDVALADVERIEVIRGPGGALWGANAVTGIINIITKSSAATQGGLVSVGGGNAERQVTARYGGRLGENGHVRIYARSIGQDNTPTASGAEAHDARELHSTGFRADWALSGGSAFTVQGDAYNGASDHTGTQLTLTPPASTPLAYTIDLKGGNLLARWKQALSPSSDWMLQAYWDYYERRYFNGEERRDTFDLDFQHHLQASARQDVVWGLGWRQTRDRMGNSDTLVFDPAQRSDDTFSAFVQDEITLAQDRLYLTLGSKFEHNDYTGFEYQPNARLRWKIDERRTAWAALSRAVHTPSRTDANARIFNTLLPATGGVTNLMQLQGNPAVQSEDVLALEAGYRIRFNEQAQAEVALFRNKHDNIMTIEPATPYLVVGSPGYRVLPRTFLNKAEATTYGLEWNASWRPSDQWQIKAAYTLLKMDIRRDADSGDNSIVNEVGRSPQNQFHVQVFHSPRADVDLSAALYYVDALPSLNVSAHTHFDARIGWRVQRGLELSLSGRNLFDPGHPEFINPSGPRNSEVPRTVFAAATWRF
jgi:iron complex outermembrane receptor protein